MFSTFRLSWGKSPEIKAKIDFISNEYVVLYRKIIQTDDIQAWTAIDNIQLEGKYQSSLVELCDNHAYRILKYQREAILKNRSFSLHRLFVYLCADLAVCNIFLDESYFESVFDRLCHELGNLLRPSGDYSTFASMKEAIATLELCTQSPIADVLIRSIHRGTIRELAKDIYVLYPANADIRRVVLSFRSLFGL